MPDYPTEFILIGSHCWVPSIVLRLIRAREVRADFYFKQCLEIADRGKDEEDIHALGGRCDNLLAGWRPAMSSFDRMLGWFPHTSREWIELIIVTVLLWLLMMAIFELELV